VGNPRQSLNKYWLLITDIQIIRYHNIYQEGKISAETAYSKKQGLPMIAWVITSPSIMKRSSGLSEHHFKEDPGDRIS
jgi:hypothetical protein